MKIAIFHNFLDNIGGAEIVTFTLARELNADIYTTNIDREKIEKMGFKDLIPKIFSIGKIPKQAPFRHQLALFKFRYLNLKNKYNFYIISGDWAMSGAVNHHPNLWYIHSPLNELWAFKDFIRKEVLSPWKRPLYDIFVWFNKLLTKKYIKKVNNFVCNSTNTQNRLIKYYNISNSIVINPPINTKSFYNKTSQNYWLSVNRIIKHKRIELQLEAFKELPNEKLIIVGSYEKGAQQFEEYKKYIESIKPSNIEIKHWVNDKKLKELYAECKGFITTARDEDFGMTVVEAMASGKPVVAPSEGGYRESIINKVNGILIEDINKIKIIESIKNIDNELKNNPNKYREDCKKRATLFDIKNFNHKIKQKLTEIKN
jgi:glycosyltransferase involved in cell wall biosynthesis